MKTTFEKTHTGLPTYPSMAACAAATGIPLPLLRQAKRAGCPAFDQANRVHLRLLLPWLFAQDAEGATDWHARWKRAQALGAEQQLANERGDLIDAHVLGQQLLAAGHACKALIASEVQEGPAKLAAAAGDIVECRIVFRDALDRFFLKFRDAVDPFLRVVADHTDAAVKRILDPETNEKTEPKKDPLTENEADPEGAENTQLGSSVA